MSAANKLARQGSFIEHGLMESALKLTSDCTPAISPICNGTQRAREIQRLLPEDEHAETEQPWYEREWWEGQLE